MYEVYTDGSCLGNPGRGGWGVVGDDFKLSGKQSDTTNNAMEMTAVLKALEECLNRDIQEVCIFTDSQYVKNGISAWIINWKKNNWVTSTGTPVKNKELWIAIDEVRNKLKLVNWKWVKAHNGDLKNEEVDKLAYEAAGGTAAKFYGIIRGHIPGIYTTWGEAKTQIDEYPGAVYKSFKTRPEAEKYMNTPVKECIYLNVPFSDKDHVKSFGAKWDPVKKKWWVQEMKPELENYIC
jgi:ribonuclease HI|tara:strand:- start:1980 stop:2687 length:708 start_codon:yes stop_codon:yes gene_type:complete